MCNGKKSNFNHNNVEKYIDHIIQEGSQINKFQLFYHIIGSQLLGLKFFDKKGKVLLECG